MSSNAHEPARATAVAVAASFFLCSFGLVAQEPYRLPPKPIVDAIDAPPPPAVSVAPTKDHLLLIERDPMPTIDVLARPVLGLAGRRIDPATFGPQRGAATRGFTLVRIADGARRAVDVPNGDLGGAVWTADGTRFAFTNTLADGIEVWIADVATATSRRVDGVRVVATLGNPVRWMPDQTRLLCLLRAEKGPAPVRPPAPAGPIVLQSDGRKAPLRTYQDLLTDAHDEQLFEHYMTSQPALVDPADGAIRPLGDPGLITSLDASPDGEYVLVARHERPFSFTSPTSAFPRRTEVRAMADGKLVATIAALPLAENVPIHGVPTGPRGIRWVTGRDHELQWTEALDGGDPKAKVSHRDRLVRRDVADAGEGFEWLRTEHRLQGVSFVEGREAVVVTEFERDRRRARTWVWPIEPGAFEPRMLFERSTQDAYGDPGSPVTTLDERGDGVILVENRQWYLIGDGATKDGDRPFLDAYEPSTGKKTRLFHSATDALEEVVAVLARDGSKLLIRRQSPTDVPNYFVVDRESGARRAVTAFADPAADATKGIQRRLLSYRRADGVPLSGTLYVPAGHKDGERLPLLIWAYPREFNDAADAGQVRGSPLRYLRLSGTSPLWMVLAGYAVLDNATMPVVGPVETANDTFVPQLIASAQAAIDAVVEAGIGDRDRVAIAGHSYGAFMTANLLAHSDLFRAGIARSGAYNRTLTPFGFQNEPRTLWQAPEVYLAMSPFLHAQKIDEPLLLIHGVADNNSGTFPVQSERLFQAVKGNGGHVRLVMLPHESHGYAARESVLHALAETVDWLDRHVKQAGPRGRKGG